MQIDRYNHLLFPRDANTANNPAATGKEPSSAAAGGAGVLAKPPASVPAVAAARSNGRPEGVVLKIQWPDGAQAAPKATDPPLYTPGRRMPAAGDAHVNIDVMARDHQLAVDRNAGTFTQISLNKDGVLVAKPHPAAPDKQPDFVALAVSAMREYSDEHARQKVRTSTDDTSATPPETPWNALKGLQQFAAKLNVFA